MQLFFKLKKESTTWSVNLKPRVLDVVTYSGDYYSNTTGKNSEPTVGSDWVFLSHVDGSLRWIKSNESLALAQRKGDTLYGILDQYTGEEMTISKVTGTPTVDGIIYFQLGSEYFIRDYLYIIPEWFGAKGDGVTDDTVAFQTALDYNLAEVVLSNKTYALNDLKIKARHKLKGQGNNLTILKQGDPANYCINVLSDSSTPYQVVGASLTGFQGVGHSSATVAFMNIEANGTGAVTDCIFDFKCQDTFSPLRMDASSFGAVYNCSIKLTSSSSENGIISAGSYNTYDFFITAVNSGVYIFDKSNSSTFIKCVTEGACNFTGPWNVFETLVCEQYISSTTVDNLISIGGQGQVFEKIVLINIPSTQVTAGLNISANYITINSLVIGGSSNLAYPAFLGDVSGGIIENAIINYGYKLNEYIPSKVLENWRFTGTMPSLLSLPTDRIVESSIYRDTASSGDTFVLNTYFSQYIIDNPVQLTTYSVDLPENPPNGYTFKLVCPNAGVETFTLNPFSGSSIINPPTSLKSGDTYFFTYQRSVSKWFLQQKTTFETSGSYIPTLTPNTNVTSVTLTNATYTKIGNVVSGTIGFQVTPTAGVLNTVFDFDFPAFARATTTVIRIGSGNLSTGSGTFTPATVSSVSTTGGTVIFNSLSTFVHAGSITFQYSILD